MSAIDTDSDRPAPSADLPSRVVPIERGIDLRKAREDRDLELLYDHALANSLPHFRGEPRSTIDVVTKVLRFDRGFWEAIAWDEFTQRVVVDKPLPFHRRFGVEWTEQDLVLTTIWLAEAWNLHVGKNMVRDAITTLAMQRPVHAVARYLDSLAWDGKPRLDTALSIYFGADDSPWTRSIAAKWLIGAAARAYRPGCQLDTMLVLEGEGGAQKSNALRALASDPWFTDHTAAIGSRDAALQMVGRWFVEYPEMDGLRDQRVDLVKEIITRRAERHVHKWEKDARTIERSSIFVGTCQHNDYLHGGDSGEARRFWPVEVVRPIPVDTIWRDRDQLWAEAAHRLRQNETWWLTGAEDELARIEAGARADDAMTAVVRKAVEGHEAEGVILAAIMMHVFGKHRSWGSREQRQVVRCLRMIGWSRQREPRDPDDPDRPRPWRYRPHPGPSK